METMKQEFNIHLAEVKAPYFEGWYIKSVTDELSLAVIFGISITNTKKFSFIQTNDTLSGSYYEEFEWSQMTIQSHPFTLFMGDNKLSHHALTLHLANDMHCELTFSTFTPIKRSVYQPTIMGPFAYFKNMECIHAVISLRHDVTGYLLKNNKRYAMVGIGYLEKDRGTSFPSSYTWFQSNHSTKEMADFFFSFAHIPMHGFHFQGCICILKVRDKQYRFATYLGGYAHYSKEKKMFIIAQIPYKVYIKMLPNHANGLYAPKKGLMDTVIYESLHSQANVYVYKMGKRIHFLHFDKGGYEQYNGEKR